MTIHDKAAEFTDTSEAGTVEAITKHISRNIFKQVHLMYSKSLVYPQCESNNEIQTFELITRITEYGKKIVHVFID